ncbi:hypothetical protein [Acinetobacter baumannii]
MITSKTILDMVEYWLNHPVNGKYGSDFGAPLYGANFNNGSV